jgi:23S rRNA (adenine2030-N6)-methyltransferase
MLSYQHSYHAGCFADVMKHVLLARILDYLTKKDKALFYLDTHAGRGLYDLQDAHAVKTNESQQGIQPVWRKRAQLSLLFSPYLDAIHHLNVDLADIPNSQSLRYYPGSPQIAIQLLRAYDRLFFCELHPHEFGFLEQLLYQRRNVFFQKKDGQKQISALLPPIERRGLVFMDPSYERKTEYREMVDAIKDGHKRCSTMTYCLWYPIIDQTLPPHFLKGLQAIEPNNYLRLEFHLNSTQSINEFEKNRGMTGSGLWVINPPYTLEAEAKKVLLELTQIIQPNNSSYLVEGESA